MFNNLMSIKREDLNNKSTIYSLALLDIKYKIYGDSKLHLNY